MIAEIIVLRIWSSESSNEVASCTKVRKILPSPNYQLLKKNCSSWRCSIRIFAVFIFYITLKFIQFTLLEFCIFFTLRKCISPPKLYL